MAGSDDLANNAALTVIARFSMLAIAALLPILGAVGLFILNRGVSSVDQVSAKIDSVQSDISRVREQAIETNGTVKIIQQMQTVQGLTISDHETRVRILEGKTAKP